MDDTFAIPAAISNLYSNKNSWRYTLLKQPHAIKVPAALALPGLPTGFSRRRTPRNGSVAGSKLRGRVGSRIERLEQAAIDLTPCRSRRRWMQSVELRGDRDLSAAVPGVAGWRLTHLPKALSIGQVEQLLASCDRRTPAGRRDFAVTGLRLSEATGLQRDEVDLEAGVLTVRQSKFGKSRLVPLDLTACAPLRSYSERRDAQLGSRCGPHFFVAQSGGRLPQPSIRRVFMQLSHEIGLRRPGDRTGPRIHDFRHNSEHPIIPSGLTATV